MTANKKKNAGGGGREQGFILAAVLWVLAIMFVVVGIFHHYVQEKIKLGIQAKANFQQQLDLQSTEQTLLYLLSSSRMTRAGMTFTRQDLSQYINAEEGTLNIDPIGDEMLLDGTDYQGIGSSVFYIQDLLGLVPLNAPENNDLNTLLTQQESNPGINTRLLAALQDYSDANDSVSLSGAEKYEYARAGLPPPQNDFLRTEIELRRVFGWASWLDEHPQFNPQEWLSVRRYSTINLNSMPKSLLRAYLGISDEVTNQLILERQKSPFISLDDFFLRSGISTNLTDDNARFFFGNEFQLCLKVAGGGQAEMISLQLTPSGPYGPWQINYKYRTPITSKRDHEPLALQQTRLFGHTLGDNR